GVPNGVIQQAKIKLQQLEQHSNHSQTTTPKKSSPASQKIHPVIGALQVINPDDLTPKEALELLYILKEMKDE
ncbi:MAG: hypothetical protein OEL79_11420, partial [Chromatiales bacterium]|nr:hypothetical protein [Chromatiales bacterium]